MNKGSLSENVLEIRDLTVHYEVGQDVIKAVNHLNLSLKKGRTLGLVGETGAGKTTTALAIQRLILSPPGVIKSGSVDICGNKMMELPAKRPGVDPRKRRFHDLPGPYDLIESRLYRRRSNSGKLHAP